MKSFKDFLLEVEEENASNKENEKDLEVSIDDARRNNAQANEQAKNTELYNKLYDKYHAGSDLDNAKDFLVASASTKGNPEVLSFGELAMGLECVKNGKKIRGKHFKDSSSFRTGVKFLLGVLVLKQSKYSTFFKVTDGGIAKEAPVRENESVNKAIMGLKRIQKLAGFDNDLISKNDSDKVPESCLDYLEKIFSVLEKYLEEHPNPEKENSTNSSDKPEIVTQFDNPSNAKEDSDKKEGEDKSPAQSQGQSQGQSQEKEQKSDEEYKPKISTISKSPTFWIGRDEISNTKLVNQKIEEYFGDGEVSLLAYYLKELEEFKQSFKFSKEEKKIKEGIYDLINKDEQILNEIIFARPTIGRFTLTQTKVNTSIDKIITDMQKYQGDFYNKARKYAEVILGAYSTGSQLDALKNLNTLATKYKKRLLTNVSYAKLKNSHNEVGATFKDVSNGAKKLGKAAKNAYDNSTIGKQQTFENEKLKKATNNFESTWKQMGNTDKKIVARAILKPSMTPRLQQTPLMRNENGTFVNVGTMENGVQHALSRDGKLNVNPSEVWKFLDYLKNTDWFNNNKSELENYETQFTEFEKAYRAVAKEMPDIIKLVQNEVQKAENVQRMADLKLTANTNASQNNTRRFSVLTEAMSAEYAKRVFEFVKNPSIEGVSKITGIFGNFSNEALYNAIMFWRSNPANLQSLNNADLAKKDITQSQGQNQTQATVVSGDVGTVYPQRLYQNAIRRKINPYTTK